MKTKRINFSPLLFLLCLLCTSTTLAGDVEIQDVTLQPDSKGWYIEVTLKHDDSGWKHYADAWRVLDAEGEVIATRVLAHPHVHEQPFTRALSRIPLPETAPFISIEAHDSVHGWSEPFKIEWTTPQAGRYPPIVDEVDDLEN